MTEDDWIDAQVKNDPLDAIVEKQRVARRPLVENQPAADQGAQMAALYQMYASQVPQGDTYRNPMTLAARAMSANNQEATPGTSSNGGMPVMNVPTPAVPSSGGNTDPRLYNTPVQSPPQGGGSNMPQVPGMPDPNAPQPPQFTNAPIIQRRSRYA